MLLLADDATLVRLHQVILLEATRRAKGCAVKYLRLAANCQLLAGHYFLRWLEKKRMPGLPIFTAEGLDLLMQNDHNTPQIGLV